MLTPQANTTQPFQSTLPVWGATVGNAVNRRDLGYFNPRSPCGERPGGRLPVRQHDVGISIHAPRVGSDLHHGGAGERAMISIHAPRVGSDDHAHAPGKHHPAISIHAPRVGSDAGAMTAVMERAKFQSTLPVWGATEGGGNAGEDGSDFNPRSPCGERLTVGSCMSGLASISIHAPRVGSDS